MISPHIHSGRYLGKRHTSYAALVFMALMAGGLLCQATGVALAVPPPVGAAVTLTGTFEGQSPATAPTIVSPVAGQTFEAIPVAVRGTCLTGLTVEVFKNGAMAGVASCQPNGSFSLVMDLFRGRNDLLARQYDQFNRASPDSAVVTVFYNLATTKLVGSAAPKIDQLIIRSDTAFKGLDIGGELVWPVEIVGGTGPYAVSYDWGDGQTSLVSLAAAGQVSAKHTYSRGGNFAVSIKVMDNAGQQATIQVLALVSRGAGAVTSRGPIDGGLLLIAWPLFILVVMVLVSFWLGEHYEERKLNRDFELGL